MVVIEEIADDAEEEVVIEEVAEEEFKGEERGPISAIAASQEKAKDLSYYHAHKDTPKEFPKDAIIREEDPLELADGLGPKKLETPTDRPADENVKFIEDFAFSDDGKVVKVYVDFPEVIKDAKIHCEFLKYSVDMVFCLPSGTNYGFKIKEHPGWILDHERNGGFAQEIIPAKSKYRIGSNGQKVSITVAKKDEKEKWYELKKKDAKSSMPPK